jgi:hypothetical protein
VKLPSSSLFKVKILAFPHFIKVILSPTAKD